MTSGLTLTSPAAVLNLEVTPPPPRWGQALPSPTPASWVKASASVGAVPGECGRQEER